MENITALGFSGLYLDVPSDLCPDNAIISNSKNFRIIDGVACGRAGSEKMQATALLGIQLLFYQHTKINGDVVLIVLTSTDIYRWDAGSETFKFLTENHRTGTVTTSGAGLRTVTLSGSLWDISWDDNNTCYIGFGSNDPNLITTWYEVDSFTDTTHLILTEDGTPATSVNYVLRKTYNSSVAVRWSCTTSYNGSDEKNYFIATNGKDVPIKWDGDNITPSYCSDLGADAPLAKYVFSYKDRTIFGNIQGIRGSSTGTALSYTIIWSGVSDIDDFSGDTAGFQEMYYTDGDIKFLAPFGDYMIVAKSDCIILVSISGETVYPFLQTVVVREEGSALETYGIINQYLGIITENDVKIFDGTPQMKSIAEGKIKNALFNRMDYTKKYLITSIVAPRYNEWRITIPIAGEDYASETWIYDIKNGEWYYDDRGFTGFGTHYYSKGITIDELDSEYSSIDDINIPVDSLSTSKPVQDVIMGDQNGYVRIENPDLKSDDGVDVECVVITKDFTGNLIDLFKRYPTTFIHYIQTQEVGDIINVQISTDSGATFSNLQSITDVAGTDRKRIILSWNKAGRTIRLMYTGRYFKIVGQQILYYVQSHR